MNLETARKIYAIDLDGTLCEGECWDEKQILEATPRKDFIIKVNELYKRSFIVIYTARKDHLIPASLDWLRRNGVMFHAISNNKMSADVYVDDKFIRPEEL